MTKSIIFISLLCNFLIAKSNIESLGDIFAFSLPASAFFLASKDNNISSKEKFVSGYTLSIGLTYLLKHTVKKRRPDDTTSDSFPSGHTASAFNGATYYHRKYGFKRAIVPYLAAIFTGYSRVYSKRHYVQDVVAGGVIGSTFSWYFNASNLIITPFFSLKFKGIDFVYNFKS